MNKELVSKETVSLHEVGVIALRGRHEALGNVSHLGNDITIELSANMIQ